MKRLILLVAAAAAAMSATPHAQAGVETNAVSASPTAASTGDDAVAKSHGSKLNPIISRIPVLTGPDRRHICLISDQVDKSWCFYVAIP